MTLQTRSTGFSLELDEALQDALVLGWLEADGLRGEPLTDEFQLEREASVQRIAARFKGRSAGDIPGVAETRQMFHRLGVDPTKTRPSSEALLRRVLQGKGLPDVLPAVDVCNLASLEHQFPLGLYDRAMLQGTRLRVRAGRRGEGYAGIRKQHVNLESRLLLADDAGPFGAPTNDSARTSISAQTRGLLCVLFCPVERRSDERTAALERIADLLTRYCDASVNVVRTVQ
jgi:DNA/RNA-binding domain of Phe-tRNA-synthetase-like protein